jgi:ribosomal protein S18 acetylase RimI-like enzyme
MSLVNLPIEVSNEINHEIRMYLIQKFRVHKYQVGSQFFNEDGSPRGAEELQLCSKVDDEIVAGLLGNSFFGALHVDWLWVHEDYRRQGYARELLRKAFCIAQERGCSMAWLDTWEIQEAYKAYEKLGAKLMMRLDFPQGTVFRYYQFNFEELEWLKNP